MSLATRNRQRKQAWTETVRQEAVAALKGPEFPLLEPVAIGVTYFHEVSPLDVDNMLKPILDGLWPDIILDDSQVQDVSGSRRDLTTTLAFRNPSPQLVRALAWNQPFVYVQIGLPQDEEEVLWIGAQ
ncbi:RusA family crossover junction endodeoxyribonuclease [Micromonospora chalcea]